MSLNTFLKYFITWGAGAVCGALFAWALFHPVAEKMLAGETELSNQIQDIYSQGTVLYEPPAAQMQAQPGFSILNGFATITISGMKLPAEHQGSVPRWYIPMKVQPVVYGDKQGKFVLYVDVKTNAVTGISYPLSVPPQ